MNPKKLFFILSSGRFTPNSLSPFAWWDNGTPYMAIDGTSWTDRISNRVLIQSQASVTYTTNAQNGKPSFTFAASGCLQIAKLSALEGISGITMWSVGKRYAFQQGDGTNGWLNQIGHTHYNDDNHYVIASDGTLKMGQIAKSNVFNYSVMVFDGTQTGNANRLKYWVNGVQQTLTFTGTIPAATETNSTFLRVGLAGSLGVPGQSLEHGIVTRAITTTEVTNLNTYLATKYAL